MECHGICFWKLCGNPVLSIQKIVKLQVLKQLCIGDRDSGMQAHRQKFLFIENPGEIPENPGKILKNMVKIPASVRKISDNPWKNDAQRRLI